LFALKTCYCILHGLSKALACSCTNPISWFFWKDFDICIIIYLTCGHYQEKRLSRIYSDAKVTLFNEGETDKYKIQIIMFTKSQAELNVTNQELNGKFRKLVVLNQGSGPGLQFKRKEHWAAIKWKEVVWYI
jgi:hypothetical protein